MRGAYSDCATVSLIVWMFGTGRFGSSAWISRRTSATSVPGWTAART